MGAHFRPITPDDLADVQAISEATWGGEDFLARVFDAWVAEPGAHFIGLEQEGRIVGCGRLMPFDRRRAWLEGLRVHPRAQGHGLGREMAHHLFRLGREIGFEWLLFSTYFRNEASIRISESVGFRRIAAFSLLECALEEAEPTAPGSGAHPAEAATDLAVEVPVTPGYRRFGGWTWNDWLFIPEGLDGAERFFPRPAVIAGGPVRMLLTDNLKWPELYCEIGAVEGPLEADPRPCLRAASSEARRRGQRHLHLMLPAERSVEPYRDWGFRSYEQAEDVFLYQARTDELLFAS